MMKAVFTGVVLGVMVLLTGVSNARDLDESSVTDHAMNGPVFTIDSKKYPGSTHIIFLESKEKYVTPAYMSGVNRFVNAMSSQPGFMAAMVLSDIDRKRTAVYYQFETENEWQAARANPRMYPFADVLVNTSARFEDFALLPQEQFAAGGNPNQPTPPGYVSKFRIGDGVATNEARVVRTQAELTQLMRRAGIVNNINDSDGFIDFTFHQAVDGTRNVNLLHWTSARTMASAALANLIQPLLNVPGYAGTPDGWGSGGVGLINVHVYTVTRIEKGRRR
jgi:hypothetical protein